MAMVMWQPLFLLAESPQFQLSASVPKDTEPCHVVSVNMVLENIGADILARENWRAIDVELIAANDNRLIYEGPVKIDRRNASTVLMPQPFKSGERRSLAVRLRCRWDGGVPAPMFAVSGTYKICFRVEIDIVEQGKQRRASVKSPWYDLRVVDVTPSEENALKALLAMPNAGLLLEPQEVCWAFRSNDKMLEWEQQVAGFINQYPNAYWAPFAHYAQGAVYEKLGTDVSGKHDLTMLAKAYESYQRSGEYELFEYADLAKENKARLERLPGLAQKVTKPSPSNDIGKSINGSMTNETRSDVEQAVRRFMAAHMAGRVEECDQMMTEDFVRARTMKRAYVLAKMKKEAGKLHGKPCNAVPTIDSLTTDGTTVTVEVNVVYQIDGQERQDKEEYTLRQVDGQWKISSMDKTYKQPPPGIIQPTGQFQQK
jgi:hypothetical protein